MVVGAFPIAKLGALLIRQISKPIANAVKERAKTHPVFRKYVCMPPAQFYNWCEIQTKMWILNLGRPVNIPVLNEAMAIELGANLVGESIIFVIAAAVLVNEYYRSARKEDKKEQDRVQELTRLQRTIDDLYFTTEHQATKLKELTRLIYDMENRIVFKPGMTPPQHPPSDDDSDPPSSAPPSTVRSGQNSGSRVITLHNTLEREPSHSALLRAVRNVEMQFLDQEHQVQAAQSTRRNEGILTSAVNYVYKEVYRLPISI